MIGFGLLLIGISLGDAGHGDLGSALLWACAGFVLIAVGSLRKP